MGSASYLLEGPFLGDRVVYSGGGCFAVRPRLLCVVSNPLRPGISRSPHFLSFLTAAPHKPAPACSFAPAEAPCWPACWPVLSWLSSSFAGRHGEVA